MILTKSNIRLFAAKYYDNPFCLSESEFDLDLFKSSTIKKMITRHIQKGDTNIKALINVVISYYNVFEHHAASMILEEKLSDDQVEYMNSLLLYLSMPLIGDEKFNTKFLIDIRDQFL